TTTEPPVTRAPSTIGPPPSVSCGSVSSFPNIVLAEYTGLSTDPALQCQCLLSVNSWLSTTNPPTRTLTRTIGTGVTTFTTTIGTTTSTVTTVVNTVDVQTATGNFILPDLNNWYGTAEPPCCYSCTIGASTVEVFFFGTPTATTGSEVPVTSFTSNGVVFESPSVYIGFSALSAVDYCGTVGQPFFNTTIGFAPDELSTVSFVQVTGTPVTGTISGVVSVTTPTVWSPAGAAPLQTTDLERNCSTIVGYSYIPGNPSNSGRLSPDPCHPTIVIPDRVRSLDPAWKSCITDGLAGFYDPPSALTSVTALIPASSQPATTTARSRPTTSVARPTSTPPPPPPHTTTAAPPPPPPPASSSSPSGGNSS
ncbi:hypothetical protein M419DRAFT_112219, partial [Trichoderma reesei RUT C-30]